MIVVSPDGRIRRFSTTVSVSVVEFPQLVLWYRRDRPAASSMRPFARTTSSARHGAGVWWQDWTRTRDLSPGRKVLRESGGRRN